MTNVATASKEQVDWAIGIIDQAGEGEEVDGNDFFKASAVLTVVAYAAFELAEEVEQLKADGEALDWLERQIGGRVSLLPLVIQDVMRGKRIREAIERVRES